MSCPTPTRLGKTGGTFFGCKTPPEFLDDVVGPMVNRRVVAHGKSKRSKFLLRDIELDEEGDS